MKKNIIIGVLILIIIALSITTVLSLTRANELQNLIPNNNNETNENLENEQTTNQNKNDETTEEDWIDYLLDHHLLNAKVTISRSKDLGDDIDFDKTITIDPEDLDDVLSKFKNNKLTKVYSQGRGGSISEYLIISYEYNDESYDFEIIDGTILIDKLDSTFVDFLNNQNYEEKDVENKDKEGAFYYYNIENYSASMFDEYIK